MAVRIGLTGGIGSGKSTVLAMLRQLGAEAIDADAISRATGGRRRGHSSPHRAEVRPRLHHARRRARPREDARRAYADPRRDALEQIVHPLVGEEIERQVPGGAGRRRRCIVFDIPLLVDPAAGAPGWTACWWWTARETQVDRVVRAAVWRRGSARHHRGQAPRGQRLAAADLVICNEGLTLGHLRATGWNRRRGPSGYAWRPAVPRRPSPHARSVILYEYPFNERIRTCLRLEHLFRRLGELIPRSHPLDHHYALATIFEVMDVGPRADLKSDVLKDLERQKQVLNSYRGNPAIAERVLDEVIGQLESCLHALNAPPGKAGQSLTENEWLMSIRSRVGIPGGTCEFDLPAYYAWQHLPADRRADLERWANTLAPLAESIHLLLKLLRDSGTPQKVMATAGQLQQTLPQGRTFQLLRLRIDPAAGLVPEISGNRLMVSVRLMRQERRGMQREQRERPFELTLCS